jgi:diacylglycerol O-acyltransferase / wax synthase
MKQLTGLDAGFLYMETGSSFGHVNSLSLYRRPDDPDYRPYESFRAQIESRLPVLEPFRRRLVEVPLQLDHPWWINDPDFDLDFHVRHIAIPPPGDDEQLANQVARIIGRPMDRSRPLWEVYVMEGLASGEFAVLTKVHHATIDGASGTELLAILLETDPDQLAEPVVEFDDWKAERIPSSVELLNRAVANMVRRPGRLARLQLETVRQLAQVTRNRGLESMVDLARRNLPRPRRRDATRDEPPLLPTRSAPATPFNRAITPHRRFAFRSVPLQDIKTLKTELGATVNDVVMAICAGALRRYLTDHQALPAEPLVTMIPVSIRTGNEPDKWTNRVSGIIAPLPTHVEDPLQRVKLVHEAMVEAKDQFDMIPADVLVDFAQFSPPALANRAMRMATSMRIADRFNPPVNLVISNVPGPRQPLFVAGAQMTHFYPVSTVTEGQGLNMTVQSYLDTLDFGLVACRELMPDLWTLVDYCVEEVGVLFEAGGIDRAAT